MTIKFQIPGKPKVLQRARKGKNGWYDPSSDDKSIIAGYAAHARMEARTSVLKCPVSVKMRFYGLPGRCDIDNATKLVFDALNAVVWVDDSQVVHSEQWKIQCPKGEERTEVEVTWSLPVVEKGSSNV
jgi:Holliday junction resolvase RusA-like endonuclease